MTALAHSRETTPQPAADTLQLSLSDAAAQLRLDLSPAQSETLLSFLALLQRWNATYNLTSVRDPTGMLTQHLADCLAVILPLRQRLSTDGPYRVLDVGSGGGLPGVVIAVMCPSITVVCVDTVGKKAAFVRQVAAELRLPKLQGIHSRVEALTAPTFDLITARAFASLADLVQLTRRHLAPGAVWMAMKGKRPDAEIAALPPDVTMFHVEQIKVPGSTADRCLVWMRPT